MPDTEECMRLTQERALRILQAAIAKAGEMGVPQCNAVTDDGGYLLAFCRMDGAKVLSIDSATRTAMTAASGRAPTGGVAEEVEAKVAFAPQGKLTNLKGGLPIQIEGHVVGDIGVGSGTGHQDVEVARAGIAALPGARTW